MTFACEKCRITTLNPGPSPRSGAELWLYTDGKGVRHVRCRRHVPTARKRRLVASR